MKEWQAICKYLFSFSGLIDLLSFLPYYLPFFFPSGAVAFRMFRVVRIFRLFRSNAYYDSLNVITQVLTSKAQQLLSSVFIILVLMTASSLCMYSLEHNTQPEVFSNAFSGIWWSVSTLLTVGYGDMYPITTMGKIFGIFITFLGWAWWPSPPALSPQASWISTPASNASATGAQRRMSTSSASTCPPGIRGAAPPSGIWTSLGKPSSSWCAAGTGC